MKYSKFGPEVKTVTSVDEAKQSHQIMGLVMRSQYPLSYVHAHAQARYSLRVSVTLSFYDFFSILKAKYIVKISVLFIPKHCLSIYRG